MGKVYYNQADSRWASHPYPAPRYENATVKSGGCGPTCAAMVVSNSGSIILPDTMADICKQEGFRVSGGTSWDLFYYIANRWGLETREVHSSYEAHQACKDGYFVVANVGPGLWTTGGHYILLVGVRGNEIEVYDPYLYPGKFNIHGRQGKVSVEGVSCFVDVQDFKAYSECYRFYAYKINNSGEKSSNSNSDDVKVKYVNTEKSNLNIRNAPGGEVIGSLPKGTQVLVYEQRNGWCKINKNKNEWVSGEYLADKIINKNIINTVNQTKKFKEKTYIYSNADLTGVKYTYLANTSVKILENVNNRVDKVYVLTTGRIGYVDIGVYA